MKRVLLFNFFAGILDRGIPAYAQDITICMHRVGVEVVELRCPRLLRGLPRPLLNLCFVLFEQLLAPLVRLVRGCSATVYPYNSSGVIDSVFGRSVLVVHDLISNHRQNTRVAARYIRLTQAVHRGLRRPICAASSHTYTQLHRLKAFHKSPLWLWTNPFYAFESALKQQEVPLRTPSRPLRVLLCSGMGSNKDYAGALKLFRKSSALATAELHILGFGHDARLAKRRITRMPDSLRRRVRVLPRLSLAEVAAEYASADIVWVHSRKEGFGRPVVEALLAGKPVIATNIAAFREFARPGVYLYGRSNFARALEQAFEGGPAAPMRSATYHEPLERAVRALLLGSSEKTVESTSEEPATESGVFASTSAETA